MFGRSRPIVLEDSYNRRSRARLPRWLVLLLIGVGAGIAGTLYVQEGVLPPRLSASESSQLRSAFEQADKERRRLRAELDDTVKQLDDAMATRTQLAEDLSGVRQRIDRLRGDVAFVASALPPDPRSGDVEVRAARIARSGRTLAYDVALVRDRARGMPDSGVMQLVVAGESARGAESTVALEPIAVNLSEPQVVRGSSALPEGFVARQCTVRVFERPGGPLLGMRVVIVR